MELTAAILQSAAAATAGYGAWRCIDLQKYGSDRRLRRLGWFFGLFALSMVFAAGWSLQIANGVQPGATRPLQGVTRPQGVEGVTLFLVLQHVAMIAALVVAVTAFGRRSKAPAASFWPIALIPVVLLQTRATSPFLLFGDLMPLLLAAEASLTLYLMVRAFINHVERKSPGALQVAMGFALFFLGHLVFLLQHTPGRSRQSLGEIVALVGIVLLVQMLPGRR